MSWSIPLPVIPVVAEALKDEYSESKIRGLFVAAGVRIPTESRMTKVELCMACLAIVNKEPDPIATLGGLIGDLMDRATAVDDQVLEHRTRINAALQNHGFTYARGGQITASLTKLLIAATTAPAPRTEKPKDPSTAPPVAKASEARMSKPNALPSIFIGSTVEALPVARAVHAELEHDLEVTIWNHGLFSGGTMTWSQLVTMTERFDFALFVFSGDDKVVSRGAESLAVRDNVLIEYGLFVGAIGNNRVFFMHNRGAKPKVASDLAGVTPLTYPERTDENLQAAVSPACNNLRQAAQRLGARARS